MPLTLVTAQADLARSAIEPLSTWMPPAVMALLMLLFALAWWRGTKNTEAARDHRMEALATEVHKLGESFKDHAAALQQLVSREQHNELARSLRADLKLTDLEVRELKTRITMMEKK